MRLLRCAALVALAWLVFAARGAEAQSCPTNKYCFYVPPGLPYDGSHSQVVTHNFDIVLSSPVKPVTVSYTISGAQMGTLTVSPGKSERISLGDDGAAPAYGVASGTGVFLVSEDPALTVDHRETFGEEQYSETIKRDTIALGSRFRLAGYSLNRAGKPNAGVDAALIYAPTGATVTLTAPTGAALPYWFGSATATISATLTAGQTIALRTVVGTDMDGALLTSSAPVAVSAGGRGWSQGSCGDDGMDGLVQTSSFGYRFAARLPTGSDLTNNESRVRVLADQDGTEVRVDGVLEATLDAGAFYNFAPTTLAYVETSKPAMVWMNGSLNGCEHDTVLIPPIVFAPALEELSLDFNVIASTQTPAAEMDLLIAASKVDTIKLDGVAPTLLATNVVPGRADLAYVRFNVAPGDRNVRATSDFQALLASRTQPSGLLAYYNPYRIPGCGDSGVDPGEQCDDANLRDGDGCSSTCQVEPTFVCMGTPSVCSTSCGNGMLDGTETCDDGNRTAGDGCNATCRHEVTITTPASGALVTSSTPKLTGSADPGASVLIMLDGATGTVTADSTGTWTYTPATPLGDGAKTTTAVATDTATGVSMTMRAFTVDSGTTVAISGPMGTIATALPTVRGSGEPGARIAVSIDGTNAGATSVGSDGAWTLPLTTPLAPGMHTLGAIATDQAGNSASATSVHFVVDTGRNEVLIIYNVPEGAFTREARPPFNGVSGPGSLVTVSLDGVLLGTVTSSDRGAWNLTPPADLRPGKHVLEATTTDKNGRTLSDRHGFTSDGDTTPLVLETPASGSVTADSTPTVTGRSSPGARVRITIDDEPMGSVTAGDDGRFTFDVPTPLGDGRHVVHLDGSDAARNPSAVEGPFFVDTQTRVEIVLPADGAAVASARPFIVGTAEPLSKVTVAIDGADVGTVDVPVDGRWTLQLPTPIAIGQHRVRARVVDTLGNRAEDEQGFHYDGEGDRDGDGRPDSQECASTPCPDTDGDGTADLDDPDDDGDGVPTAQECTSTPCPDTDGDGKPDYLDPDDDGDGRPTREELGKDGKPRDTDGDGTPDHLDPDDDGDSISTRAECVNALCEDTDGDGAADYLDPDDDDDRVPTAREKADSDRLRNDDADGDGRKNWLDPDANGNGTDDGGDGIGDRDGDGTPDYLDTDTPGSAPTATDFAVAGGGGCAVGGRFEASWLWALALLLLRRRSALRR